MITEYDAQNSLGHVAVAMEAYGYNRVIGFLRRVHGVIHVVLVPSLLVVLPMIHVVLMSSILVMPSYVFVLHK